jgi:hypothetical protein
VYIRQPIQQRRPVSYDIAFLEAYEPNHTHYLPSSLRLQLQGLAKRMSTPAQRWAPSRATSFEDVNKRTSRLAANIPLARHNLAPLSFVDVPPQAYIDGLLGVYETKRVDLLRDVFVWAYERSCQQYTAVKQQLVVPDTFRLLHRPQLAAAIQTIIRNGSGLDDRALKRAIPVAVDRKDRERFTALLRAEFETLHAGNAVRFGLQLLEFEAWQQEQSAAPAPPRKTTRRRVNRKGS